MFILSIINLNQISFASNENIVTQGNINVSNINPEEIKKTVDLINNIISGTPIDEVSEKLEFEVKPIIGRYVKEHERLYNIFSRPPWRSKRRV